MARRRDDMSEDVVISSQTKYRRGDTVLITNPSLLQDIVMEGQSLVMSVVGYEAGWMAERDDVETVIVVKLPDDPDGFHTGSFLVADDEVKPVEINWDEFPIVNDRPPYVWISPDGGAVEFHYVVTQLPSEGPERMEYRDWFEGGEWLNWADLPEDQGDPPEEVMTYFFGPLD